MRRAPQFQFLIRSFVQPLILAVACAGLLTACGAGSDSSSTNAAASAQSKQLQRTAKVQLSDYQTVVQYMYISYFGRPADPAGLAAGEAALLADGAPTDLQDLVNAYGTNSTLQALINSVAASPESVALYGSTTTGPISTAAATTFVTALYQNVLGRAPDTSGLAYWVNQITTGQTSQGNAGLTFMLGALLNTTAQGQQDAVLIANRLTVAEYFTSQVTSMNEVSDYSGTIPASIARTMLSTVNSSTNTTTFEATVNSTITTLIPVTISGTVSGLVGSSSSLVLQDNSGDNLTLSASGSFTFATPLVVGANYSVSVLTQPNSPAQTCTVSSGSGTVSAAVTTVAVTCAPPVSTVLLATGDSRTVTQPSYPPVCQTVTAQFTQSQRATPPTTDDTTNLQNALTACAGTGGSVVLAASGTNNAFFTNSLNIVGGESLVINSGVVLYGNNSYVGNPQLIGITGTNASIMGPGTIDGRGDVIVTTSHPRLVQAVSVNNFIVYNVTLTQAIYPNLYVQTGNGLTVWGVTIQTPATRANADGIDIDSFTNATVINSFISAGDDGIAVKTNSSNATNITVENTRLYGTHGLSVGSIYQNTVQNILFQNNYVYGNDWQGTASTDANAINIKTYPCSLNVQQVTYTNTCIKQAKHLIVMETNYTGSSTCTVPGSPNITDIVVNGVSSTQSVSGAYTQIYGQNASFPVVAYLANVSLDATGQSGDAYANVSLDNSNDKPSGNGVTTPSFTTFGSVPSCSF